MDHYPERFAAGWDARSRLSRPHAAPAAGQQRAQLRRCAAEVLRQAADEWLLFSAHDAPPGFTRRGRGHVRLRANIDVLARSAQARGPASGGRVRPGWTQPVS